MQHGLKLFEASRPTPWTGSIEVTGRISNQSIWNRHLKSFFDLWVWFLIVYSADFDFDCKSHFGLFCNWSAVGNQIIWWRQNCVCEYKVKGAILVKLTSTVLISCGETSQDDEDYGYEDDITAQPATSTSIDDDKIRAMNLLSSSDKTVCSDGWFCNEETVCYL